jgi:hypothetical protein
MEPYFDIFLHPILPQLCLISTLKDQAGIYNKKSASQLKFLTRVVFFHNAMLLVIPVFMLFGDFSAKD